MLVNVEVTQRHIDEGRPGLCKKCVIALALNDCLSGEWSVTGYVAWHNGVCVELPDVVCEYIVAFDAGLPVSPFTFPADVPDALVNEVQPCPQ